MSTSYHTEGVLSIGSHHGVAAAAAAARDPDEDDEVQPKDRGEELVRRRMRARKRARKVRALIVFPQSCCTRLRRCCWLGHQVQS